MQNTLDIATTTLHHLFNGIILKLLAVAAYLFGGFQAPLSALLGLFILDLCLGVYRAVQDKQYEKKEFTKSVPKAFTYGVFILAFRLIEIAVPLESLGWIKPLTFAIGLLAITELTSIVDHADYLSGGKLVRARGYLDRIWAVVAPDKKEAANGEKDKS